ncbi:hypothetical protein BJY52DRAFT_1192413 [Lactarius psammicola]|nr:hypothetical protein BJY52DRAFT_1192413 [Lactarius psammicola]
MSTTAAAPVGAVAAAESVESAAAAEYELWCLIEDEQRPFSIFISSEEFIFQLQKQILLECNTVDGPLKGAHAKDLKLTKVDVNLRARPNQTDLSSFRPSTKDTDSSLYPTRTISDVWPTKPLKAHLSVFVHLPSQTAIGKRPLADDSLDIVREAKIFKFAPSQMGWPSTYKPLQKESGQRMILDDRPTADPLPPASLLYHGFGRFMDDSSPHKGIRMDEKRRDLERHVYHFAREMAGFHEDERARRENGLDDLKKILGVEITPASIGAGVRTDCHYLGPHDAAIFVVEFKNEPADNKSMPMVELTGHVAHSHKQSFDKFEGLFKGWNVPCLGLTVVGPYITFYGIIFLGQWRVVTLTPTLSCMASACDGRDRMALYAAFYGASALLRCIHDDVKHFIDAPPTSPLTDRKLPYVSELPGYPNKNEKIRFRILGNLHDTSQDGGRNMYIAETSDKEKVIVKFTHRYSIELHAFCAERGHAPRIFGFGSIPGGWSVTAMDYIPASIYPSESTNRALRDKWKNDLKKLVESFHAEDLVHGDLRQPNMIICGKENIMLVDFDWGGRVGEALYPRSWLNPELTDGRESVDQEITKDDDNRILRKTLAQF